MNDKDTKAPIYIAIMVAFLLVAAAGYLFFGKPSGPLQTGPDATPAPTPTPKGTVSATVQPTASGTSGASLTPTSTKPPDTIKCELCHADPQNLGPHVNGGKLCVNCHGSQVHNIHIGTGTVNLDCSTCHGFPPKIPTVQNGTGPGHYAVCENCHASPPDSLKPSYGNLIVVHLSRGKYCTNCHGTDVYEIHKTVLGNATKQ